MTKQEISELKKLLTPKNCSLTRICGCYVDGEKNKKTQFKQAFLALPEEEMFKYFEILRKTLSGSLGKNLLTLEFPLNIKGTPSAIHAPEQDPPFQADISEPNNNTLNAGQSEETMDTPQDFLLRLRDSKLKDDTILEAFYDKVIENYEYVGNYLILLVHDVYDIPGKTTDGIEMDDASDEIYEYIICCVCPVELSKPGLSYNPEENTFQNRVRDWVVSLPETGFLFPAFHDRSTDIHSLLYYSKNSEELRESFVEPLLGCPLPLSAGGQKETFQAIIEDTLGEDCGIEMVKNIHDKLNELAEEYKESPQPLMLDKNEVKTILADSGVANERLTDFDKRYDETAGEKTSLFMSNVMNTRTFEVKTPDIIIKVNPERTDLIETRNINGRECLVIALDGSVEVNGISVRSAADSPHSEEDDGPEMS
ncbi:MAG: DUF4317 domain-containing protein [Lachnospiraceae bacterium]|nr:DUF4317 domain-containing protein [Lachnospiraceae bacterium]